MLDNRKVIIDDDLLIADTGSAAIDASAAATVDAVAKTIDTGGGLMQGMFVVDVASIAGSGQATNCQLIQVELEGSTTSTFTAWVRLAGFRLGPKAVDHGRQSADASAASSTVGRYMTPFHNDFHGTVYRWLRVYTTFNGSANAIVQTPTIKFKAWLSKL